MTQLSTLSRSVPRCLRFGISTLAVATLLACSPSAESPAGETTTQIEGARIVSSVEDFADAVANLAPGDTVVIADGTYTDFEITFTGEGTDTAPIRLMGESPGGVILTGQSNLRLSGEYLEVSNLVFTNGYTPTAEVISFRTSKTDLANNSRVHNVVIDDYNPTSRAAVDFWVMMDGRNNRFDHNALLNKRNKGVTMAVRLNTEASRDNNHRIDHNYFGPRPILGSNGGETLRVGVSKYSLTESRTLVENNVFDRCDGEVEIISSKSGSNIYRNNRFIESRGTLTLRHGNGNLIERNVFQGNGVDHTGGFRVINARQTVRDNYMEGLTGSRFGGALVVMNGVPNSPINRYHQVDGAVIETNSLIDSDNIQLGAGSDAERSAVPINSTMTENLVVHTKGRDSLTVYDDMSGIAFSDNVSNVELKGLPNAFAVKSAELERAENGLLYPVGMDVGAPRDLVVTQMDDVGPDWYAKAGAVTAFGSGKTISVKVGDNLAKLAASAGDGDVLKLAPGTHVADRVITTDKTLTISGGGDATLLFARSALAQIDDGGSLRLEGLSISGAESPDNVGNVVIRTSPYSMLDNYRLEIVDVAFEQLDVNHSFDLISAAKGTFADTILLENVKVSDLTGHVLRLDRELDDYGIYPAEYVTIVNSSFENIGGTIVDVYRGGTDESTFGPHIIVTDSEFDGVGANKRNKSKGSFRLHGAQVTNFSGNTFTDSRPIVVEHTVGEPKSRFTGNDFGGTSAPTVVELAAGGESTAILENNTGMRP